MNPAEFRAATLGEARVSARRAHEALKADFEELLNRHLEAACCWGCAEGSMANELVHLVVLHGLLPEVPKQPTDPCGGGQLPLAGMEGAYY